MNNKNLLHKNQLANFAEWLLYTGITPLTTKGLYEVLRFDGNTRQMPIVYKGTDKSHHLACNDEAAGFVRRFINYKKGLMK